MKRFVIFSQDYGVYLGNGKWSKGQSEGINSAPTFEEGNQLTEFLRQCPASFNVELREIVPDMPGLYASMNKVAEIGLPRWGKDGAPDTETVQGAMGEDVQDEEPAPKKSKKGKK